ncbi:MAG: 50S ribosomal protein L17 [Bacteroidota bacterium]|nr:50S ribosomal protein L17 [Bacteroidota bacterium]
MRHGKKINSLGRKAAHRKAMLSNMACSLIEHKRIKTTVAKAKALRKYLEPLITKSKNDTTHSRRIVFSHLRQKQIITELFGEVASKVADRQGGYTRILRLGNRLGDNAEMCLIELVDYNEIYTNEKPKKSKSTRRSRGGSKKIAQAEVDTDSTQNVATPSSESEQSDSNDDNTKPVEVVSKDKVEENPVNEDVTVSIQEDPNDEKNEDQEIETPKTEEVNESTEKKEDKSE